MINTGDVWQAWYLEKPLCLVVEGKTIDIGIQHIIYQWTRLQWANIYSELFHLCIFGDIDVSVYNFIKYV